MMKRFAALVLGILLCIQALPSLCEGKADTTAGPGLLHFLVLGFDFWGDERIGVSYSDTNILASVDTANNRLLVTCLLRDSWVQYPDGKWGRLNGIVRDQGFEAMLEAVELNYQVHADHYLAIGVKGLQRVIDALGGVEITLTKDEAGKLKAVPGVHGAGTYTLGGYGAVQYMRIRYLSGYDFARTERQRKVLAQVFRQIQHMSMNQALELARVLFEEVETNMSLFELIQAVTMLYGMRGAKLEMLHLPASGSYKTSTIHEMAVLELDWALNRKVLHEFLYGKD